LLHVVLQDLVCPRHVTQLMVSNRYSICNGVNAIFDDIIA